MTTQALPTTAYVKRRAYELSERDLAILQTLAKVRLATTRQLQRLHVYEGTPIGNARVTARVLKRLADNQILIRLPRQVGGIRAGSASIVFTLARPAIALLNPESTTIRTPSIPGDQYVGHALAVTELYANLKEIERAGLLTVVLFKVEPRRSVSMYMSRKLLRPDAYAKIHIGQYSYSWFIEMDLATERRPQLRQKIDSYLRYWGNGKEQARNRVFPKVLFLVPDSNRKTLLEELIMHVPSYARELFQVELIQDSQNTLSKEHD